MPEKNKPLACRGDEKERAAWQEFEGQLRAAVMSQSTISERVRMRIRMLGIAFVRFWSRLLGRGER